MTDQRTDDQILEDYLENLEHEELVLLLKNNLSPYVRRQLLQDLKQGQ